MNWVIKPSLTFRRTHTGQSMTEYALILAAVAIIAFAAYKTLGNDINSLLSTIAADI